jgi:ribosomal protein S18 acetylase RimI-like enzyme
MKSIVPVIKSIEQEIGIMPINLQFRLISNSERDILLKLFRQFVKEHEQYEEEDIEAENAELEDNGGENWFWLENNQKQNGQQDNDNPRAFYPLGLFLGSELIGFSITCCSESKWIVLEFSIISEYRNRGFGSKFAKAVIDFCISRSDASTVSIEASSNVNNVHALKFWNSLGFKTVEENISFQDRTLYGVGSFNRNILMKTK